MVKQTKKFLRRLVLDSRGRLSEEERGRAGKRIVAQFLSLPEIAEARNFLLYASVGSEVDTWELQEELQARDKMVALPLIVKSRYDLSPRIVNSPAELHIGTHGIPQPVPGAPKLDPKEIEVAVLPGVAFDLEGWRLGHGGGYYDRFLHRSPALRVGLAFEAQIIPATPLELHDQRVDILITEDRIVRVAERRQALHLSPDGEKYPASFS